MNPTNPTPPDPLHQPRTYRHQIRSDGLVSFKVTVKETDLLIRADTAMAKTALDSILCHRGYLESVIARYPEFASSLVPWTTTFPMPEIVRFMISAGMKAGVGPMASVAGAVSQCVGADLLTFSKEVIVENGGDVFFKTNHPITVGVFAGGSPLNLKIGLRVFSEKGPKAVCTSSGTVGHSLSYGKADAVCVVSDDCALADAAATAIGNRVQSHTDIADGIGFGKDIEGVDGVLIIVGDRMGAWGALELVKVRGEKRVESST